VKELPLCSVVIPTYGRPHQLVECLRALAVLDYPRERFEVVVVDDGSEPPLAGIANLFEGRLNLTVLRQGRRSGPAAARNVGAAHAGGTILAFTDDDCRPEQGWLRTMATHLEAHPGDFVGGRTINGLPDESYPSASQTILDAVYTYYNADPRKARFFASNNIAMSAERFHSVDGFDVTFRTSEDRELCDRWLRAGGSMSYVAEACVVHAHHLTLRGFVRQHFHYGRGAFRFLQARIARGDTDFNHPPHFYKTLLVAPFTQRPIWHALHRSALLALSQVSSVAGFTWERVRRGERQSKDMKRAVSVDISERASSCFAAEAEREHVLLRRSSR
jgi:GT2 family glycosyltransferase